jgi:hypothetical protein
MTLAMTSRMSKREELRLPRQLKMLIATITLRRLHTCPNMNGTLALRGHSEPKRHKFILPLVRSNSVLEYQRDLSALALLEETPDCKSCSQSILSYKITHSDFFLLSNPKYLSSTSVA